MKIPAKRRIGVRKNIPAILSGAKDLYDKYLHKFISHPRYRIRNTKYFPYVVGTLTSIIVIAAFLFLFTEQNPFQKADIYPENQKDLTAGTVSVLASANEAVFTLKLNDETLAYQPDIKLVSDAYADDETDPTALYQVGGTTISSEVKGPDGELAKNVALSISGASEDLTMTVKKNSEYQFRPGVYKIYTTLTKFGQTRTITQDFAWGVLAINSLKSVYTPGETAIFHFGVLDELGNTLCNAGLKLDITSPSGKTETLGSGSGITNSEKCDGNTYIAEPDYSAEYKVSETGTYKLALTAVTDNGKFFIDDALEVQESVPFEVERTTYPTRIYPAQPYPVTITVTANQDFEGAIIESVPESFEILNPTNEATLNTDEGLEQILWPVNLKKGETIILDYTIIFPEVSPEFYLVGPLQFKTSSSGFFAKMGITPPAQGQQDVVFQELRQWQIASDAVVVSGGIVTGDAQFGGNQRKVVYVNSNWYAFYNDAGSVTYKKSSNGTSWGSTVDMDAADSGTTDEYNPTVDVSGNTIIVFWVDDGDEELEGRTIDTASSDTQGTLCGTGTTGSIGSSFMPSVAAFSTTAAIVTYSDTSSDTEVEAYNITGLSGACTATDVSPGNIAQFGAGITSGDKPTLVGISSTTAAVIFQDGNLSYSLFDTQSLDWTNNNITIASVTDTIFSVVTDGTTFWILSQDSTTATRLYSCCTADIAELVTPIDSDAGTTDDDGDSDIDMFCPTEDNCKIVYTDDIDTAAPILKFVDCGDATCSTSTITSIDTDLGDATDQAGASIHCVTDGTSVGGNCKVVYATLLGGNSSDVIFMDCTNDEDCSTNTKTTISADIASAADLVLFHSSIHCPTNTNCKFVFTDELGIDVSFADCNDATCTVPVITDLDTDYGAGAVASAPWVDIYCVAADNCKVAYHDNDVTGGCADANSLCFVDCTADEDCSTNTSTAVDSDIGTTQGASPVSLDCIGGDTDCKVVYGDVTAGDMFFVDCGAAVCDSTGRTITQIDAAGGADTSTFEKATVECGTSATDCKIFYVGDLTSTTEDAYLVDCDDATCTTGSILDLPGPRFGGAMDCVTNTNCKLVYYDGTSAAAPAVQFADCDTEDCLPTASSLTAPWTSETNITSVSLTYDSSNSDLIASTIKDASETAYYRVSDAASISWGTSTAYDGFTAAGDQDNISTPETAAGTTPMGALLRQGSNMEFDLLDAALPIANQNHYRFRDDTTALNTDGGWLANEDSTLLAPNQTYRLRVEIANTGTGTATNYNYRLEYAQKNISCADSTFATVPVSPTTEPFETVLSSQYADAAAISSTRLTATGSFVNGIAVEDPSNSTGNHTLAAGEYSEFEFAFAPTTAINTNVTYCFRVTNAGSTSNFTYSSYPEISVLDEDATTVLYWALNDRQGTTAQDSSPYNLDGTLGTGSSAPTWNSEEMCVSDGCLLFDGNSDYVSRTDDSNLDFATTESFTVQAWAKHNDTISTNPDYIISKADATTGGYKLWMDSDGDFCFGIDDDATWGPDISACSSAREFDDGKWHHIVGVRDTTADAIYIYVDGLRYDSQTDPTSATLANTNTLYLGADRDVTKLWAGYIDEVKISREAKSADEVKTDFIARGSIMGVSTQFGHSPVDSVSNGLVGFWKMEEDSGTTTADNSGNNRTGTYGTGQPVPIGGKFGKALGFTLAENDVVSMGDTLDMESSDFTISAWVKSSLNTSRYIVSKYWGVAGERSYQFGTVSGSGWLEANLHDGVTGYNITGTTVITDGAWHHVVFRKSGTTGYIYVDKTLNGSGAAPSSVANVANHFVIGAQKKVDGTVAAGFNGTIDEVRIYNRALSEAEITALYDWTAPPILHWKLDENTGTSTVYDIGSGTNDGTMGGTMTQSDWIPGKFGSALQFDGVNDQVVVTDPTDGSLDFVEDEDFSIAFWLYSPGDTVATSVLSKKSGTASNLNGYQIELFATETIGLHVSDGTDQIIQATSAAIPLNQWIHLEFVYIDDTEIKIYLNGAPATLSAASGTIANVDSSAFTSNFAIMTEGDVNSGWVEGSMDDVRIYSYARTSAQVIEDMNGGHPVGGSPIGSTVGYWKFDEGAFNTCSGGTDDFCDSSPHGNGLALSSNTGITYDGKFGKAFNPGTAWAFRTDDVDFDFAANEDVSLSMWVKSPSTSNPAATQYLIAKHIFGSPGYDLYFDTSGRLECFVETALNSDSATSTTDYYDNAWHHVACVRDTAGDRLLLYVDGVRVAQDTNLGDTGLISNANDLFIGDDDGDVTNAFTGYIDEVKIYRSALTTMQVQTEYNGGKTSVLGSSGTNSSGVADNSAGFTYCPPGSAATCTGPVAEWKLDENTGTTSVYDTSGNGNTASMTNFTGDPWRVGRIGSALVFDGSNDALTIAAANDSFVDFTGSEPFSLSAWVYVIDIPALSTNIDAIIAKWSVTNSARGYRLAVANDDTDNTGHFRAEVYDQSATQSISALGTTDEVLENNWYHIYMTFNGGTSGAAGDLKLYVNGSYKSENIVNASFLGLENVNVDFTVGEYHSGDTGVNNTPFTGTIDHVRVYDYVRTPAQIAWEHNQGAPIGWYKFDECTGTTANNSAPDSNGGDSGNDGTIYAIAAAGNTAAGTCSSGTSTEMWNDGTTGKISSALGFDGSDDYVEITDPDELYFNEATQDFSIFAWVKRTATGVAHHVISAEEADNDGWRLVVNADDTVTCSVDGVDLSSSPTTIDTNWHHIGCTIDRDGNGTMYIDSTPETSPTSIGSEVMAISATGDITIGDRNYSTTSPMNGLIDDLRIFNYALTSQQVREVRNNGAVSFR